jgi:hypothetical protein
VSERSGRSIENWSRMLIILDLLRPNYDRLSATGTGWKIAGVRKVCITRVFPLSRLELARTALKEKLRTAIVYVQIRDRSIIFEVKVLSISPNVERRENHWWRHNWRSA